MRGKARVVCLAAAVVGLASATCWADALVLVAEDGGFGTTAVRTVRSLAASELRKEHVAVADAPQFDGTTAINEEGAARFAEIRPERLFVLRLGRLDEKVPFTLEELDPVSLRPLFVATLTATSLDEADMIIERLVVAVLNRQSVERGVRLATVTKGEARKFRKKPGEGFWMFGLGVAPLGLSLGWQYEMQNWRLGATLQGAEDSASFTGIEAAWIPSDRDVSLYVGGGLGITAGDDVDEAVLGAKVEVGVEAFRLHGVRLLAGAYTIIRAKTGIGNTFNPGIEVRVGF
jgi:hypothetical protein